MATEEGIKLYTEKKINYEFDHYSGEVKSVFVKQTVFDGGKLNHGLLIPFKERIIKEIDNKWCVGIMVYGANKQYVKNETKVS